jgi:hypothetical protein
VTALPDELPPDELPPDEVVPEEPLVDELLAAEEVELEELPPVPVDVEPWPEELPLEVPVPAPVLPLVEPVVAVLLAADVEDAALLLLDPLDEEVASVGSQARPPSTATQVIDAGQSLEVAQLFPR